MAKPKKAKAPKTRTTPAEERAFIISALEKEANGLEKGARKTASKGGGYDFSFAADLRRQSEVIGDVIQLIYNLDE